MPLISKSKTDHTQLRFWREAGHAVLLCFLISLIGTRAEAQSYLEIDPRVLAADEKLAEEIKQINSQMRAEEEAEADQYYREGPSRIPEAGQTAPPTEYSPPTRRFEGKPAEKKAEPDMPDESFDEESAFQTDPLFDEVPPAIGEFSDGPTEAPEKAGEEDLDDEELLKMVATGEPGVVGEEDTDAEPATGEAKPQRRPTSEMALFERVPMVITASKRLQPVTEAPASVYVITSEDIKQNPSIHLYDLLRQVPGMDVVTATFGQAEVSMRGQADLLSNKTLLLIDGRSMYLPMQGLFTWELFPVQPEEIERIEIVKGPVAALYGANANLGLINVITKKPEQVDGTIVSNTFGTQNTRRNSFVHSGQHKGIEYKISGGSKQTDAFEEKGREALRDAAQANFQIVTQPDQDSELVFSGGMAYAEYFFLLNELENPTVEVLGLEITVPLPKAFFGPVQQQLGYVNLDYASGNLESRFSYNIFNSRFEAPLFTEKANSGTVEGEVRYRVDVSDKNTLTLGVGGRFDRGDGSLFSEADDRVNTKTIWNVYVQDEYDITEQLTFSGAARVDHYPYTGFNPSYRGAFVYSPDKKNVFRLSGGYSFRNPTLSDHHLLVGIDFTFPGLGTFEDAAILYGNTDVEPERYTTWEFGYQGNYAEGRFRPFLDVFYTELTDYIQFENAGTGLFGFDVTFANSGRYISKGGEAGFEWDILDNFTLIANYALNKQRFDGLINAHPVAPVNKFNAGVRMRLLEDKLTAKFMTHWVGDQDTLSLNSVLGSTGGRVESYVLGNVWVGYQMTDHTEVSIAGYNIFNDEHRQALGGTLIDSRVLGKLEHHF